MFIIPGYVNYYEQDESVFLESKLKHSIIQLFDKDKKKEFFDVLRDGGVNTLSSPLTEFLHDNNMLLKRAEIDRELSPIYEMINKSLLITIMPTEGCNFKCAYCYENHTAKSMSETIINSIIKYLEKATYKYKYILVNWFGGEPTICTDTVLRISKAIKCFQQKQLFHYSSNMTTNGYLLDKSLFIKLYNEGVTSFQITIDGWNHDSLRPHINGTNTRDIIINNLKSISQLSKTYDYKIMLRHNILAGDEDYSWYDYLYDLFHEDNRFSVLVRPVGDWGGDCVKNLSVLKYVEVKEQIKKHVEYLNTIGLSCNNERNDILSKSCYASYPHSVIFRVDGRVERCTVALNHTKNVIGKIVDDSSVEFDSVAEKQWSFQGLKEECYSCKNLLSCFNMGCKKNGVVDGSLTTRCDMEMLNVY